MDQPDTTVEEVPILHSNRPPAPRRQRPAVADCFFAWPCKPQR
jgi:hypothetical protein